jgi:phospholipid-translocating ATPase
MTVKSGQSKRLALLNRRQHRNTSSSEKRGSGDQTQNADDAREGGEEDGDNTRTIFFNQPLPQDLIDEEGHPIHEYPRNKIRTAKYTAVSFIPKNLWFQFHNVANIFFLFLIILGVSPALPPPPTEHFV